MSTILFTLFSISSLNCMEPEKTTQKKSSKEGLLKKSKSLLSIARKFSNEKIDEQPATDNPILEHPFIIAAHSAIESKDYTAIQFHLKNPHLDLNVTDKQGYSALQIFIQAKACQGIELLLPDHRVYFRHDDLFKKNSNQIRIFECLDKNTEVSRTLHHKIFARFNLDMVAYNQCKEKKITMANLTPELLTTTINDIKAAIEQATNKQIEANAPNHADAVLPKFASNLPDYATDEFIEKKIWFILSSSLQ